MGNQSEPPRQQPPLKRWRSISRWFHGEKRPDDPAQPKTCHQSLSLIDTKIWMTPPPQEKPGSFLVLPTSSFTGILTSKLHQTIIDSRYIVQLLTEKKEEFILLEATKDRPIKVVLKGLQAETDTADIVEDLRNKVFAINRISPMKNYKLQKSLDMFLLEVKKEGNYQNIYNVKEIGYVIVRIEQYRSKNKATICFNCSGFHHSARNCHQKHRCIKCNGEHPTRECGITEKIENSVCINCGEKGHLAAWRGCKALPVISKTSQRIPGKSFAQAASQSIRKDPPPTHKESETVQDPLHAISDIRETLQALKEIKEFLEEFPTLLEAAKKCKAARTREEKLLIVLEALADK
ncbi:Nucleic-acid-binding protein from transposon X-element [Araneus ventricosus]|uniref:Nucleic-acid-binding protein from transposon X-element n=1 Tax=Araneus ventricosus TaxID=182803 RepID=A0A4Y2JUC8_ARAVE|nr:Nucleic-acid-binding protein from transposon X-element [Araneus ventricosus]